MGTNRRTEDPDRRAHPRGGRREGDLKKPWYMRRRLWLAAASIVFVGWRRMVGRRKSSAAGAGRDLAA